MADEEKKDKKIIIDESWKQEAQRDKEVMAAKEAEEKKKEEEVEEPRRGGRLPQGDLPALISLLTTQALFALGLLQLRGEEEREPDLELARYNIDMLQTLADKTKGNLTPEEEQLLKNTLSELRMGYVNVSNQLTKP